MIFPALFALAVAAVFVLYLWSQWVQWHIGAGSAGFIVYALGIVLTLVSAYVSLIKS